MFRPQASPIHFFVPKVFNLSLATKSQVEVIQYTDRGDLLEIVKGFKPSTSEDIAILVLDAGCDVTEAGKFGLRDGPYASAIVTCCSRMQTMVALYNINRPPMVWEFASASLLREIVTDDPSTHAILYERALDACIQAKRKEVKMEHFKRWLNLAGGFFLAMLMLYLLFLQTTSPCHPATDTLRPVDLSPCFRENLQETFDSKKSCTKEIQSVRRLLREVQAHIEEVTKSDTLTLLSNKLESVRNVAIAELKSHLSEETTSALTSAQKRLAACEQDATLDTVVDKLKSCSVSSVPVAICVDVPLFGKLNVDWAAGFRRKLTN